MTTVRKVLAGPFSYVLATKGSAKLKIELVGMTIAVAVFLLVLFSADALTSDMLSDKRFVDLLGRITNLMGILSGFFMASLGVVAGAAENDSPSGIDANLTGDLEDTIDRVSGGPISRRRFLTRMFAYLTASSFCIFFAGEAVSLTAVASLPWMSVVRSVVVAGVFLWLSHVLAVAVLGLYFLSERIATV